MSETSEVVSCPWCSATMKLNQFAAHLGAPGPVCGLCGEPMPPGEEMFTVHGYSGPCPMPPERTPTPANAGALLLEFELDGNEHRIYERDPYLWTNEWGADGHWFRSAKPLTPVEKRLARMFAATPPGAPAPEATPDAAREGISEERHAWEGVVVDESKPDDEGETYALDEGKTAPGQHSWSDSSCWLHGLVGKRVRLTVEVLDDRPELQSTPQRKRKLSDVTDTPDNIARRGEGLPDEF